MECKNKNAGTRPFKSGRLPANFILYIHYYQINPYTTYIL